MSNKVPQIRFNGYSDAWVQRELSEVARYRNGKAHEKSVVETGPFVIVNSKFVSTEGQVRKYSDVDIEPLMEDEVAIVLSDVPNGRAIAKTFKVDRSGVYTLNQRIAALTAKENFSPSFLQLVLDRNRYFLKFDDGVSQTNLSKSDVLQFTTAYPTIEEQRRIGLLFESLDNLIAANQRKLDLLKEQKKGYLQKMFPKNGAKVPELRFAGFADDWEERKLKDVVEKQIKGKAQFEKLAQGDVEYLDTSRLNGGQAILTNGLKDVTLDDILILWDGSKAGTVYHGFEGALGSTLKAYRTSANSKFVYQYLKRHQDNIYNNYRTPNIPHVQKDFLNVFTISVPGSDEQAKIGSFFKKLDDTIALHQRKLDLLKEQKKGFLQKMFV